MNLRIKLVILLFFKIHICNSESWSSINSPIDTIKFASYVDYSDNVLYYSSTIMNENQDAITDIYYFDGDTSIKLVGTIQGFVYAITEYNGHIIIGGDFNSISNQEIRDLAIYNVDHFESFVDFDSGYNTLIKCFALFNEKLYIGGAFRAGISLITWDSEGVSYLENSPNGIVNTIYVKNDTLYVGGIFKSVQNMNCENIAKTDGENWFPMNIGLHGAVLCIGYLNGKMYIGGYFFNSEDTSNVICSFTNEESGSWNSLTYGILGSVTSLVNFNNKIYAAGMFDISGGYNGRNNITTWDGVNWSNCDGGVLDVSENAIITSIAIYNNHIYLFGKFTSGNNIICKNVISIHN